MTTTSTVSICSAWLVSERPTCSLISQRSHTSLRPRALLACSATVALGSSPDLHPLPLFSRSRGAGSAALLLPTSLDGSSLASTTSHPL
eukprot:scaffold40591_cov56-Phaeocystis_antarctica.AAC.4